MEAYSMYMQTDLHCINNMHNKQTNSQKHTAQPCDASNSAAGNALVTRLSLLTDKITHNLHKITH